MTVCASQNLLVLLCVLHCIGRRNEDVKARKMHPWRMILLHSVWMGWHCADQIFGRRDVQCFDLNTIVIMLHCCAQPT